MKNNFLKFFSIAFIVIALCVSCADDGVSVGGTAYKGVSINGDATKSLSAKYDGFSQDYYIWFYKTSTTDSDPGILQTAKPDNWTTWSDVATGYDTESAGHVNTPTDGCVGLYGKLPYDYNAGGSMWQLELQARTTDSNKVVYEGKTEFFKVDRTTDNSTIYVPLNYQDISGEKGSLAFNYGEIEKLGDFGTTDTDLTWTTEANVWLYSDGSEKTDLFTSDSVWMTATDLLDPDSYVVYAKYKSYGVTYEIADTVNVHSNITATVTGKFSKRITKDIKVFYHDGKIINNDGSTRTETNIHYSGKDGLTDEVYRFENFLSLPYEKDNDPNACIKDGYTFIGWYTTDTSFTDTNRTTETAWQTEGFVRTNSDAEFALKQAIFVNADTDATTKADLDFVLAYTTMTDVAEENWCYEIHLYARWIPNTISAGADTRARDNITLDYTSYSSVKGFNASANITINTSQTEIQGFEKYSDVYVYADEDNNFVYVNDTYTEDDATAKTTLSESGHKVAVKKFVITGFYDEEGKIVVTNDGIMARENGESVSLSKLLDPNGTGWIHQDADPFVSTEVTLYAYWREEALN